MKALLCAATIALFATAGLASTLVSDLLSTSAGQPAGETRWTYSFSLQSGANMRLSCAGLCSYASDFVTLYDFAGYVPGTVLVTSLVGPAYSFDATVENVSLQAPMQMVADDPSVPNIRVSLSGGGDILSSPGGPATPLFELSLNTQNPGSADHPANLVPYSAQTENTVLGTTIGNSNFTAGPAAVPEPGTYALVGLGLAAASILRRRPLRVQLSLD